MNNNYRTLHKDIGLTQRSNNGWDLWFEDGDTVQATEYHSLQVGIILACLTSWNYLNRYGNPTYEIFGNRAYELLKTNKSSMVQYKIQQYFIECLKRMRRVYEIVSLEVYEKPSHPYTYFVEFEVLAINNQLVSGEFTVNTEKVKSTSYIEYYLYTPYCSNKFPLQIDLYLKNEYGGGLSGEILYMYTQEDDGETVRTIVGQTDDKGYIRVNYLPTGESENNNIHFEFQGNTTYNPTKSEYKTFETEQITYEIQFLDNDFETNKKYVDLHLQLRKQSLKTHQYTPLQNVEININGSDNSYYTATTNEQGQAKVTVKITETTTFTTTYDDATDTITVTKEKITPKIRLSKDENSMRILLIARLYDNDNNPLTEHIDGLTITFRNGVNQILGQRDVTISNGIAIASATIPSGSYPQNWFVQLNGNDYYNATTEIYEE